MCPSYIRGSISTRLSAIGTGKLLLQLMPASATQTQTGLRRTKHLLLLICWQFSSLRTSRKSKTNQNRMFIHTSRPLELQKSEARKMKQLLFRVKFSCRISQGQIKLEFKGLLSSEDKSQTVQG